MNKSASSRTGTWFIRTCVAGLLLTLAVVAILSQRSAAPSTPPKSPTSYSSHRPATEHKNARDATLDDLKVSLLALRAEMFVPGTGEQKELKASIRLLFERPNAISAFIDTHDHAPLEQRWGLLHLAGFSGRQEIVEFLGDQLLVLGRELQDGMVRAAPNPARTKHTQCSTQPAPVLTDSLAAAMGLVDSLSMDTEGAADAVDAALSTAEPRIAQLIGMELFSRSLLTGAYRQKLTDRGIS